MEITKLKTPLFYDGMFNRENRRNGRCPQKFFECLQEAA